jgi:hypothetical protein
MMNVSSVCGIPVSKLYGNSPSGLNSTGGAEERSFYDIVQSAQNAVKPEIQKFINILASWKGIEKNDHTWIWNSLYTLTEMEISEQKRKDAETEHSYAQADQLYLQSGVVSAEDIYSLRFEDKLGKRDINYFGQIEPEEETTGMPFTNEEPKK